jgi:hypothetical protein
MLEAFPIRISIFTMAAWTIFPSSNIEISEEKNNGKA